MKIILATLIIISSFAFAMLSSEFNKIANSVQFLHSEEN